MSSTHPTRVTTEWEDLQVKYGNFAERPKEVTNEEISSKLIEEVEKIDVMGYKTIKELDKLEDEIDGEILASYRERRLKELKDQKERLKFGEVYHVRSWEYVEEVTNASSNDQIVLLHIYSTSKTNCDLLNKAFKYLAKKHADLKFCVSEVTETLNHTTDSFCPILLIYQNRNCLHQFINSDIWGKNGPTPDNVEWVLWKCGVLPFTNLKSDPRGKGALRVPKIITRRNYNASADSSDETGEDDKEDYNSNRKSYTSLILDRAFRTT